MKFPPKSADDRRKPLLESGTYAAIVRSAYAKTSSNKNEMIKLILGITHDGRTVTVPAYLVCGCEGVIHNFLEAVGLRRQSETGELHPADCEGLAVDVKLRQKRSDDGEQIWNDVIEFLPPRRGAAQSVQSEVRDEIPY